MRFCVIGAGSGGRAFAAYIASKGYPISLYNRSFSRIKDIKEKRGIKAIGALEGFYPIDVITQDLKLAVKDADVLMVVTPASSHKEIAKKLAPFLTNGQIIILNPGRTFGSIEFKRIIKRKRSKIEIYIGEAQTLLFTARELEGNLVNIIKIKDSVNFSTFPEKHVHFIYDVIKEVFPQFIPIDDYLEVTLNNIGMLLHPAISLFNAASMERGKKFKFYRDGATSRVCEVLENVQLEINKIFKKLGLKRFNYQNWAKESYGINANSIFKAIQNVEAYKNIQAPQQLITRYFTEDIPTGLVPTASLGKFLEIDTPTINSIIHLSNILCGSNFRKKGRTVKKLKLQNLLKQRLSLLEEEILKFSQVNTILTTPDHFKVCTHCGILNEKSNEKCWVCQLRDFKVAEMSDLNIIREFEPNFLIKVK